MSTAPQLEPDAPGLVGQQPLTLTSVLLVMVTVVVWAGTPTAVRFSTDLLPPITVAGLRFALAAIFMAAWAWLHGTGLKINPGELRPMLLGGLLMFLQIGTFTLGVHYSNASHGSIFINTYIFWVVAIDHFVTKHDRLTIRKGFGLIFAAAGAGLILSSTVGSQTIDVAESASINGDLLLVLSAFILGGKICYTKNVVARIAPDRFIFWHDVFGVALFAVCAFGVERFDPTQLLQIDNPRMQAALWGIAYQGFAVAGLCYALQTRLLEKHAASKVAVFSFATPLFGVLFAVLLRGDPISSTLFVSGLSIAIGILLVNYPSRSKPATTTP
ncbi:EamA family transporter [bacterium]|nr:EamA family transporter [bacterium]